MTLRQKNIRTPKDLAGKLIAAPDGDAGRQLFPAFSPPGSRPPACGGHR